MNGKGTYLESPRLLVFSSLFPHPGQVNAGLFIRERMFRVGEILPLQVVAPVPWFPLQGLIRIIKPNYRPRAPRHEVQYGNDVYHPRFLAIPGILRSLDGIMMALGSLSTVLKLHRQSGFKLIDAHFSYPDGYAATLLGQWLKLPVTITLRGTEVPQSTSHRRPLLLKALQRATHIFSVSDSLKQHVVSMGIDADKVQVVGNGVDTKRFYRVDQAAARRQLELPEQAKVLITVGGLVERKGYHRVIECLPSLLQQFPNLHYLVVGGASGEGDWTKHLHLLVQKLALENHVHFLGTLPPDKLKWPLSAADVFVLATRNEGWANVLLEAMACGLPVVATDVGGNAEVVSVEQLGRIVPFGDHAKLEKAIAEALLKVWDSHYIVDYASENSWDNRVEILVARFRALLNEEPGE